MNDNGNENEEGVCNDGKEGREHSYVPNSGYVRFLLTKPYLLWKICDMVHMGNCTKPFNGNEMMMDCLRSAIELRRHPLMSSW